jgi:hypothetical protein
MFPNPMHLCGERETLMAFPATITHRAHMLVRFLSVIALVATISTTLSAQTFEYPIEIDDARVGLPPGRFGSEKDASTQKAVHIVKRGEWAPVYLDITLKKELPVGAKLIIETVDGEDLKTKMVVPLTQSFNGILPGAKLKTADFGYTPYVRCGDRNGVVTITIVTNDADEKQLARSFSVKFMQFRDVSNYVILSLGSRLPGFDLPSDKNNQNQSARAALRGGRIETSAITDVMDMPDQWIGYQAVDLVVLTTGTATNKFLNDLFGDNIPETNRLRREALLEYVRRGGKLLISVASNAPAMAQYKQFQAILPAPLRNDPATKSMTALPIYANLPGTTISDDLQAKTPGGQFPVANVGVNPRRAARTIIPPPPTTAEEARAQADSTPVVLQAPFGLGRVSMTTFDLDQSPFLDYGRRADLWDWLLRECGSQKSALTPPTGAAPVNNWSNTSDNEDEWASTLRRHVDTFDGVPVVSFWWVAMFIILYTLVIGPIEYLVLKYVFRRLELTWITFPIIVVSVSAAAYFTAYAIKGNDLKINKVDVVDIDLQGGRVYGKSWFTIFSPRIDNYTIGVEPRAGWTVTAPGTTDPAPLVGWMGGGSAGSGSIVSRGYTYHAEADNKAVATALDRVPIQVWSTKAFTANWSGSMNPGTPLIAADLYHPPGDPKLVTGSFVSNLPVATLTDPYLIYAGKVYKLPAIQPGQKIDIPAKGLEEDNNWYQNNGSVNLQFNNQNQFGNRFGYQPPPQVTISSLNIWGMLFHEKVLGSAKALSNASMRDLDMSWRIEEASKAKFFDEAILVANISPPAGPTEAMLTDPTGPSATTLWLKGGLPGGNTPREPIPGTLRQETYIRVFIPIRSPAKK